jgi:hypothetical protein
LHTFVQQSLLLITNCFNWLTHIPTTTWKKKWYGKLDFFVHLSISYHGLVLASIVPSMLLKKSS